MLWLFVQSLTARGVGVVSQLLLARVLMPADFGLIGLAYTVTSIVNSLVSFGVDDVLLQRSGAIRLWSTPAFWISLSLGTLGMTIMLAAAPLAARAYGSPHLVGLIALLAIAMPISTLSVVPMVMIRASMNFRFLATYNTVEMVALQAMTILLAWIGFGAYSFAIPAPVLAAVRAAVAWAKAPAVIRGRFRRVQLRYMFGNSSVVFATRTMLEVIGQGGYIVLGLIASQTVVGLYFFAFRFSLQPVRMLAGNFTNVLFPAFAQLRSDPVRQTDVVLRASRFLTYLVMPFCFLQAALAEPGLHLLFGDRWVKAVPLVQVLSIGLPFDAVSWVTGALLVARREFNRSLRYTVISAPLFFLAVGVGGHFGGAVGVALGVDLYYLVYPPLCSILVLRGGQVRGGQIAELYLVPALLASVATGLGYLAAQLPGVRDHDLSQIAAICAVSGLLYPGALYLWRRDMFDQMLGRARMMTEKLRRRVQPDAALAP